jgi:hypothetical protein
MKIIVPIDAAATVMAIAQSMCSDQDMSTAVCIALPILPPPLM